MSTIVDSYFYTAIGITVLCTIFLLVISSPNHIMKKRK